VLDSAAIRAGGLPIPAEDAPPRMPPHTQKPRVLLDWFTVSYRSAMVGIALLIAAVIAAAWYLFFYAPSRPRADAADAISRADVRLAEAGKLPPSEHVDELRGSARSALGEARDAFSLREYDDARVAAFRSETFSQKAIDMSRGGGGDSKEVRIYRMEGDVRVKRAGEFNWEPADRKMELQVGDQVKTAGSGSIQLIYFDGTLTTIKSVPASSLAQGFLEVFADVGRGWLVGPNVADLQYSAGSFPDVRTFRADVGLGVRLDDIGLYIGKSVTDPHTPINFFARLQPRF